MLINAEYGDLKQSIATCSSTIFNSITRLILHLDFHCNFLMLISMTMLLELCLITICNSNVFDVKNVIDIKYLSIQPQHYNFQLHSGVKCQLFCTNTDYSQGFKWFCIVDWFAFSFCSNVCVLYFILCPKIQHILRGVMYYSEHTQWIQPGFALIVYNLFSLQ